MYVRGKNMKKFNGINSNRVIGLFIYNNNVRVIQKIFLKIRTLFLHFYLPKS